MRITLSICLAAVVLCATSAAAVDVVRWVDPFIGTGGHGHTFPGPSLPFGMVQLGPDTRIEGWDGCSGYHYSDDRVFGFSHTHLSGTGVGDYCDILFLPGTGPVQWRSSWNHNPGEGYGSRFQKRNEAASAGYYSVTLDDYDTRVELTATARAGMHRYRFPAQRDGWVLIDLEHRDEVIEASLRVLGNLEVEGSRRSRGWASDQRVYFVARFSRPFQPLVAVDDIPRAGLTEATGKNIKAILRFPAADERPLLIKVGLSAVSTEGARLNLDREIADWDFDRVHRAARETWNRTLSRLEIEGATPEQRTIFYTGLYHALLQPNLYTDADGRYRGRDGAIHHANGWTQYTVFSLWDTFRAAHPLYTILEPARTTDFIQTFLAQVDEGGLLPVWELSGNETNCMIGYHAASVIADAWAKGIRGFDPERALVAMQKSAMQETRGLGAYRRYGFVPGDQESESVSKTLEYAYDDWCIARMAAMLGRTVERDDYLRCSKAWRNLLDPATRFMRPKLQARFKTPFDPTEVDFHFTEANSWQYSFFVPHDVEDQISAFGGPEAYVAKLDSCFESRAPTSGREQADITGLIGQYAHGNEPSHHMAYLYAFAGQPWKTQAWVHEILSTLYRATPDGLCGNEDCGQMSAWYVLSSMGFYSVTPGQESYVLGSPLFERVTIRLPNGRRFRIAARNASRSGPYIQSARLNGRPFERSFLRHDEILAGGNLDFVMGSQPNHAWGSGVSSTPKSRVEVEPSIAVPYVAAGANPFRDSTRVVLATPDASRSRIRYTQDGSEPDAGSPSYMGPIRIDRAQTVRFRAILENDPTVRTPIQECTFRKIDGNRHVVLASAPHRAYTAGGNDALIDGLRGGDDFRLGTWQGFYGVDLDAVVDLGAPEEILRLGIGFLQDQNSWIFMPLSVSFAVSKDGKSWQPAGEVANVIDAHADGVVRKDFDIEVRPILRARWIRIQAKAPVMCPEWHKGAGNRSFIFADEILVE